MDTALNNQREWGTYKREIYFDIYKKPPLTNFTGVKIYLLGEFDFNGIDKRDPALLKGSMFLNSHSGTAIQSPVSWLSNQFHENVHFMEHVERTIRAKVNGGAYGDDNDGQLLAIDNWLSKSPDFSHIYYTAYKQLPNERLAHAGQGVLEGVLKSTLDRNKKQSGSWFKL